ncbi:polysaccharide deacetylase family protein [Teredinibacter haidensis]|uniref:polysaccharide deacetylase family protein n=1 Tax=Teredinibacter haidensis TaxID=2731755 RepID=UPI0009489882|nr:polysaccharide deacetylase family protein [Teredinibacter haidensis]
MSLDGLHQKLRILVVSLLLLLCTSNSYGLVVLQYHHISTLSPAATSISPALFESHLRFLEEQGFTVLPIERLSSMQQKTGKGWSNLPDKSIIITFDDGYRSIYQHAWPLLKRRGWPFTVFINSKPHDESNPLYMSWEQLRELAKAGATVANHSDSHPHFIRQREGESSKQWQQRRLQEITFAEQRIKKEIGKSVKMFAHPFGEYDSAMLEMLAAEGYLGFGQQSGPMAVSSHPQAIPRFPFGGAYGNAEDFATKVYSLPFPQVKALAKDSFGRSLPQPELPSGEVRPELTLNSPFFRFAGVVQCFASGQGSIPVEKRGSSIITRAERPLAVGRSRYNCTAHAGQSRYYWYSQLFIRRNTDGSWYAE